MLEFTHSRRKIYKATEKGKNMLCNEVSRRSHTVQQGELSFQLLEEGKENEKTEGQALYFIRRLGIL